MDGTSVETLHDTNVYDVHALTLDYTSQKLYWVDNINDHIEMSNCNGTERVVVSTAAEIDYSRGIAVFAGDIFWTEHYTRKVYKLPLNSSTVFTIAESVTNLYGLQIYSKVKQPQGEEISFYIIIHMYVLCDGIVIIIIIMVCYNFVLSLVFNPCSLNNGGCSYLCLLSTSEQGFSCACPIPMILDSSGRSCESKQLLLFTNYYYIHQLHLAGHEGNQLVFNINYRGWAVDFDVR